MNPKEKEVNGERGKEKAKKIIRENEVNGGEGELGGKGKSEGDKSKNPKRKEMTGESGKKKEK